MTDARDDFTNYYPPCMKIAVDRPHRDYLRNVPLLRQLLDEAYTVLIRGGCC